ncbi:hypothetical protein GCM10028796_44480 [Ramlibacter monticola]|uniref:Uncharacterized protein n=1 Tax=Ramlibacter monticola TaxID=1926872 RepID=A0A937CU68_9BURK|nr:hypothetical protein [Ramlibacter monticola]MBL0393046.1 hypothetical protein [Ramlibacter monticola]
MARAAHLTYPAPVLAGTRPARANHTISRATALGACLFLLSAIGSVLVRAAGRAQLACAGWAERRREREEDRKLWELALSDSRVMADLVALSQQTSGETARIFLR